MIEKDGVSISLSQLTSVDELTFSMQHRNIIISAVLGSDNFLNIGVAAPSGAEGKTRGLLGKFDGNSRNDLTGRGEKLTKFLIAQLKKKIVKKIG